jgi:hypothetical protein
LKLLPNFGQIDPVKGTEGSFDLLDRYHSELRFVEGWPIFSITLFFGVGKGRFF